MSEPDSEVDLSFTADVAEPGPDVLIAADTAATATAVSKAKPAEKKKEWFNVYVAMLMVSLAGVLLGCLFLALELGAYGVWPFNSLTGTEPS